MPFIKSRKHLIAATASNRHFTAVALLSSFSLVSQAQAIQTTTLDKINVQGEQLKRYSADKPASGKYTQPLIDTTQTINIIGKDLLNEQGATSLSEALRNSPGVGTFYVGENGTTATGDATYMRGFDSSSSIYVDGIRDLGSITRDVFNLEQIEVTKGPSSSDYGRTSPTGAINLITKQPFLRNTSTANISYGTASQRRFTSDLNLITSPDSAFRLNVMGQDSGVPGRNDVKNKRWGFAPSAAFGLETSTRVFVNLQYINQENIPDGGVLTIGLPGYSTPDSARTQISTAPRVDSKNFYGTRSDFEHVKSSMATVRIEHDIGNQTKLQNTLRWGRNEQRYLLTSYRGNSENLVTPNLADPSTWTLNREIPTFKDQINTILTNQTNLNLTLKTSSIEHNIATGVELTRERMQGYGISSSGRWPAANLYHPNPDVSGLSWAANGAYAHGQTDTTAFYLFDTLKFSRRWYVNGGLRWDRYNTDYSALLCDPVRGRIYCNTTTTILDQFKGNASGTLFGWKTGVLFKPTEHSSLYINYAVSQQPPGGASLELSAKPQNSNNPNYRPQTARTAETGVKWNSSQERLQLTAAIYNTEVKNDVVQDPIDLQYYQNGEKRVRGVELSAVGQVTDAWSMSAGFTTMDAKVKQGPAVSADGSLGLAYTPNQAFTAWTTYTFPFGLTIGGGARYAGEMKRDSKSAIGTPTDIESYWVIDMVLSYRLSEHLDLRLNSYNLLDKDYVAAINKSGYRYAPGTPRAFLLTANLRF
ncbi:catecholate siderophore receptor Fiu [Xylella taiwanensis]|uniref:Catecholate siderophore receptor Fiu n=1 Tax=Xylella taiwanensis TaxID=1444770 RepID=Z9JMN7_9GAMM|nr:catecholate siderophore receptor Fiu [Xylella taiwanensis]AXI84043.1 catecholate siderophore receptor Fiu [Xylella taiwanensis]EWS79036.1 catecholate siderophore receptor Fiu [Xylella taiwanensis]MCD8457157.1 catecholate siderophore receptor Fiu [Xylella taiwanensis]MCD8459565.1 catecholate siderophore receptor Fiu [Xylella taiwanensis]MCD8461567.1 catecholate siderophore receptor Fiu [Xylella taiwanensis]